MHHLTYKRAGRERSSNLQHICLLCHMEEHPEKAEDLLQFELTRSEDAANYAIYLMIWMKECEASEEKEEAMERQREEWLEKKLEERGIF